MDKWLKQAVIGLSGGIDSALSATLAVHALGPERVIGVAMPSRYSSESSLRDARDLANRLGIRLDVVPIEPMFDAFLISLSRPFRGLPQDVTEENLQARIRGTLLMAYANKLPSTLVFTTGNKSELAVGYCTLYGDMSGGLAVISDLYKTEVYALARFLNGRGPASIPESTLSKAPSAELRPNQTDQDALPHYDLLDVILRQMIDHAADVEQLCRQGMDRQTVERVWGLVEGAEYKRRQMAPGLRVSAKAFGEGRRIPIARRY
ncbi:MAG: NAD(+) synthase [Myxococcota bacterium]